MQQPYNRNNGVMHQQPGANGFQQQPYRDNFDMLRLREGLPTGRGMYHSPPPLRGSPAGPRATNLARSAGTPPRSASSSASPQKQSSRSRGKYRCKKCGQLKKGHICTMENTSGSNEMVSSGLQCSIDPEKTLKKFLDWLKTASPDKRARFNAQMKAVASQNKYRCLPLSRTPYVPAASHRPSTAATASAANGGAGPGGVW